MSLSASSNIKPPVIIEAEVLSSSHVSLAWRPAQGFRAVAHCELERSRDRETWKQVYAGPDLRATDSGLQPRTPYYYRVRTWATAGGRGSAYSAIVAVVTQP